MRKVLTAVRKAAVLVDRWHWLVLLLVAPLLMFPTPARSSFLLVVPGLWIIAGLAGKGCLPRTPLNGSLLALEVMVLVSLYATYDIEVSLPKIAGLVLGFGVYFAVVRLGQERAHGWKAYLAFLLIGVVVAGLGLLGTQWLNKIALLAPILDRLPPVLRGLAGAEEGFQPNQVAGSLLWILPAMLGWVMLAGRIRWQGSRRWRRGYSLVAIIGSVAAAVFVLGIFGLTQSRSGYIGLVAGLAAMVIVWIPARWRGWLIVGLTAALIAGGVFVWQRSATATEQASPASAALSLDTLEGRYEVWSRALYGIQDFPISGMGLNTFRHIVHVLYPLFLIGPEVDLGHAHNEFLQAALDLGLPGLIAFVALYVGAFGLLREIWHLPTSTAMKEGISTRALALGLGGGLVAHLVYGLTDAVALGAKPGFIFWMLLGLIAGLFLQTPATRNLIGSVDQGRTKVS